MVEKFDSFDVKKGKLIGTVNGKEYEVDSIIMRNGNRTEVTYYDDGEKTTITQSQSSRYRDSIAERATPST